MEFEIDLPVTGQAGIDGAATSVLSLADQLARAGAAQAQVSDAFSAAQGAYAQAEAAADKAAKAVERIGLKADEQRGKLQAAMEIGDTGAATRAAAAIEKLTAAQSAARDKSAAAQSALAAEAASLDKLKSAADAAAADVKKLQQAESDAAKAAKGAGDATGESALNARAIAGGFGKLGGPLGDVGQKVFGVIGGVQKLSKGLGAAGPYAIAAAGMAIVIAGAVLAAAAIGAATLKVLAWAVANADAARSQMLLSQGIEGTVEGGKILDAKIMDLADKVPLAADEIAGMAKELRKTGLEGQALADGLQAAAVKASQAKFGPNWQAQMISLEQTTKRFHQGIEGMFSGLKVDGALQGLAQLSNLFDKDTESGKAIKVVFESMFQPLLDGLSDLVPKAEAAFIEFEILCLRGLIAIKPFGSKILLAGQALAVVAAITAGVLAGALGVVIGLVTVFAVSFGLLVMEAYKFGVAVKEQIVDPLIAFASAVVSAVASSQTFAALAQLFTGIGQLVGEAFDSVTAKVSAAGSAIAEAAAPIVSTITAPFAKLSGDMNAVGTGIIDGLVKGILLAGPNVLKTLDGIATDAIKGVSAKLGIHSPSTVFAELGMHTAAGMAEGIDEGGKGVQSSLEAMVAPPDAAPGKSGGKGGGTTITIGDIIITGVAGAEDIGPKIKQAIIDALDGATMQMGGAT